MPKDKADKKNKLIPVFIAVILVTAVLSEFVYYLFSRQKDPADFPALTFAAGDFTPFDMERTEDGDSAAYKTLTADSYFAVSGLGGVRVETVDIFMARYAGAGDVTEAVIKVTGRGRGVSGTFTVGMKETAPGVYRAYPELDSVESILICPTEMPDSSITFDGINLNPYVSVPRFSPSRALLWASLLTGLICLAAAAVSRARKIRITRPWLLVYLISSAAVTGFAFLFTKMFSSAKSLGDILIPISFSLFSLFYLFVYFVFVRTKTIGVKVLLLFLFCGSAFSLATAPLQVPDENIHFTRSYAIAMGDFGFDGDFDYPGDVRLLYETFTENLKLYETYRGQPSAAERMENYFARSGGGYDGGNKAYSTAQLIIPYIPGAIGVAAARLFSEKALFALYACRLANVLMAGFAAFFAVRRAARYTVPLLALIFFPLTVFMSASASYDAMLLAAMMMFFGLISAKDFRKKDFILLAVSFAVIIMIKPLYLPLALLIFAVPKECFRFKAKAPALFGVLVGCGALLWALSLLYAGLFAVNIRPSDALPGVDRAAQILYILKNPLRFIAVCFVDGFRKLFYFGEYGLFGHLDLTAGITSVLAPSVLAVCSALASSGQGAGHERRALAFGGLSVGFYFVISAGFYVVDSVLGGSTILGVQARYFAPCLFLGTASLGALFGKFLRPSKPGASVQTLALCLCFAAALTAAFEIFFGYYL